jgi:hypothetical protein
MNRLFTCFPLALCLLSLGTTCFLMTLYLLSHGCQPAFSWFSNCFLLNIFCLLSFCWTSTYFGLLPTFLGSLTAFSWESTCFLSAPIETRTFLFVRESILLCSIYARINSVPLLPVNHVLSFVQNSPAPVEHAIVNSET